MGAPISIRVEQDADGKRRHYLVGQWPDECRISPELLRGGDEPTLQIDGSRLTIDLANGRAVYLVEPLPPGALYHSMRRLVSSRDIEG
jgi:hypothetical protein